jgi:hypothetical protein
VLAQDLVRTSERREPLKLGILLLGITGRPDEVEPLLVLGRHDEFTLFAAVALGRILEDPEPVLFQMARDVRGWGRIHLVERLAETSDPVVADWLLREGYRNDVLDAYTAHTAAVAGRLADRLDGEPDEALLDSACHLIETLLEGGPVPGIEAYPDAPRAIGRLLALLAVRPPTCARLLTVHDLDRFLEDEDGPWAADPAWADVRGGLRQRCAAVLARPEWPDVVEADLRAIDPAVAATGRRAARVLGMDTFELAFMNVATQPPGHGWYELMQVTDAARIERVVDLAERVLPLGTIASGPGMETGMGPGWEAHHALDWVLQGLERFPGAGWSLLRAALSSPVIRHRNLALRCLDGWPRDTWPPEAAAALGSAAAIEPDERVRATLERMHAGGRFAEPRATRGMEDGSG